MGERALETVLFTLKAMANGGMHDHVGQVREIVRREGGGQCTVSFINVDNATLIKTKVEIIFYPFLKLTFVINTLHDAVHVHSVLLSHVYVCVYDMHVHVHTCTCLYIVYTPFYSLHIHCKGLVQCHREIEQR